MCIRLRLWLRRFTIGDRLMVGLQVLVLAIEVRILVPEQTKREDDIPSFLYRTMRTD